MEFEIYHTVFLQSYSIGSEIGVKFKVSSNMPLYMHVCVRYYHFFYIMTSDEMSLWRHQIETFSVLLALCAVNSPVPGEFPAQRPVMRSFDAFFDLHPNNRLSKQWWVWWFETLSCPLWRHRKDSVPWKIIFELKYMFDFPYGKFTQSVCSFYLSYTVQSGWRLRRFGESHSRSILVNCSLNEHDIYTRKRKNFVVLTKQLVWGIHSRGCFQSLNVFRIRHDLSLFFS